MEINVLSEAQAAYIAGVVDGEGTITLANANARGYRTPVVSIATCDLELVQWIAETTGVGTITRKVRRSDRHRQAYQWMVKGRGALAVMERIAPYLRIDRKWRRAIHVARNYDLVTPKNGRYSEEARKKKEEFEEQFWRIG